MVEAAADLHSCHLAVEKHRPRGVSGDLTGVLLPSLAAPVCKGEQAVSQVERGKDGAGRRDTEGVGVKKEGENSVYSFRDGCLRTGNTDSPGEAEMSK